MGAKMNQITIQQILEKFSELVSLHSGEPNREVSGPSSMEHPKKGSICYVAKEALIDNCVKNEVSVIVVPLSIAEKLGEFPNTTILASKNIHLAMATINTYFFNPRQPPHAFNNERVHSSAVISDTATIGSNVFIGPGCVIEDGVVIDNDCKVGPNTVVRRKARIGKGTCIGANTVIEPHAEIGESCYLYSQVFIGHHCVLGKACVIQPQTAIGTEGYGYATDSNRQHHFKPHYGRVVLGDRVEVGGCVCIDRGVYVDSTIGDGTKIDNYCHLAHNITMGKNCLITAGIITAGSVKMGDNCVVAGRVSINGHLEITDNVVIGPISGVSNSIREPGQYGGWPLQSYKDSIKTIGTLRHLTKMWKDLQRLKRNNRLPDESNE